MLNILIIGAGQCGNRILDSINKEAFGEGDKKYLNINDITSEVEKLSSDIGQIEAVSREREKKDNIGKQNLTLAQKLEGLEPSY